uniref:NgoMIV restriction enzyme n=1 Tax=Candidatus Kentrum eta TaxID=2126337 RepID=A0A450V9E5_9GAMM|nr:MAG: NgoMIV restriction enzyme [Candidatus Kentron sp. H]VFJ92282.1 MAG: NgoMIV restriction enzyme [Candidatus Kentron sp. H]VFK01442.1 MAG: NgoMIV restriction enzyme [Candidatus Kentron sp. H]
MKKLAALRGRYHEQIGSQLVRASKKGETTYPNFADGNSQTSVEIARGISAALGFEAIEGKIDGQTAGNLFETLTRGFIASAFATLAHLRPGEWTYQTAQTTISKFVQYQHLSLLDSLVKTEPHLAAALGQGYIVTPDIVIVRQPVTEDEINHREPLIESDDPIAELTQFRASNQSDSPALPFLHASVSCKWTIRSDRSQNTRTEALNLIRNRKGSLPHIVAVTAEPLPMRIASLALGTGDLDCVYHFALPELRAACATVERGEDQLEMLDTMIRGNRLRDISDLPFDLAV